MVKRKSYVIVCHKQFENGLEGVEKVIQTKNLGYKVYQLLMRQISCVQSVASRIDECYGLSYDEILDVLQEFYGYEIVDKKNMVETYNYSELDTYYNWELYAQNDDYAKECDALEVEGLRDRLKEIIQEKY